MGSPIFKVTVLEVGTEEELGHWTDGYVPRRGETISFDYRGNWTVQEVDYRVFDKRDEVIHGVPLSDTLPVGVHAFVYVEKKGA